MYHVKLDSAGRVLIPARLRQKLHVREGDTLVFTEDQAGAHLQTLAEVIKQSQDYFAQFAGPGVSLVDELLQDRRDEAARE